MLKTRLHNRLRSTRLLSTANRSGTCAPGAQESSHPKRTSNLSKLNKTPASKPQQSGPAPQDRGQLAPTLLKNMWTCCQAQKNGTMHLCCIAGRKHNRGHNTPNGQQLSDTWTVRTRLFGRFEARLSEMKKTRKEIHLHWMLDNGIIAIMRCGGGLALLCPVILHLLVQGLDLGRAIRTLSFCPLLLLLSLLDIPSVASVDAISLHLRSPPLASPEEPQCVWTRFRRVHHQRYWEQINAPRTQSRHRSDLRRSRPPLKFDAVALKFARLLSQKAFLAEHSMAKAVTAPDTHLIEADRSLICKGLQVSRMCVRW